MLPEEHRAILDEIITVKLTDMVSELRPKIDELAADETELWHKLYTPDSTYNIFLIDQYVYLAQILQEFSERIPEYIAQISSNYPSCIHE